jgi:hypothetical protein
MVREITQDTETAECYLTVLNHVLGQLVARGDMVPFDQVQATRFHAVKPPAISVKNYLERMVKYAPCSKECYVLALIYIDRLVQNNPGFTISSFNIHRLAITSLLLATKFYDDLFYNNAYYGQVGGISTGEMNLLELEFLFMVNFSLHVDVETFERYDTELRRHAQELQFDSSKLTPVSYKCAKLSGDGPTLQTGAMSF